MLTEIRDKKKEEERKAAEAKQGSADKENNKNTEKTAPSLASGEEKVLPLHYYKHYIIY